MAKRAPTHPAALPPEALLSQCQLERTRGSGPGGQHRNKTETAVRLTHTPTGVTAQAGERRSQVENRRVALRRLRINLALHVRSEVGDEPSEVWQSRRQGGRIAVNPRHEDFPALLAEALDCIDASKHDITRAAKCLGVTTSQLIKLLKLEPHAHHQVNADREQRGLKPLH